MTDPYVETCGYCTRRTVESPVALHPDCPVHKHGARFLTYDLFGVECNEGWRSLYEPLIQLCRKEGVSIFQVKEKFGGLRFYVGGAPKFVMKAIDEAEKRSFQICEFCGTEDDVTTGGQGWIFTLCSVCREKRRQERGDPQK